MKRFIQNIKFLRTALLICCTISIFAEAGAFNLKKYAEQSCLSNGNWLKIGVTETGIYFIPNEQISKWGFANPEKVSVFGYGGEQLSDILRENEYIDDLPPVQFLRTNKGIYFYGIGPVDFYEDENGFVDRKRNIYSNYGYYYLTDGEISSTKSDIRSSGMAVKSPAAQTDFIQPLLHETEEVNYGSTGRVFLGEDFRLVPSRSFGFELTDKADDSELELHCWFASRTTSESRLYFSVNGNQSDNDEKNYIPATVGSNFGVLKKFQVTLPNPDSSLSFGIMFQGGGVVKSANLDYILVNYRRKLSVPTTGNISFITDNPALTLIDHTGESHIWDVSNPLSIAEINALDHDGFKSWISDVVGKRKYVVWSEKSSLPLPDVIGKVTNQNLHDISLNPEMIIISTKDLVKKAEEIADIHREKDGMDVLVVCQNDVFNEFSSGTKDPGAFRRFFKMMYDRNPGRLKYGLFLGRGSYDNRGVTTKSLNSAENLMPLWQSEESMIETVSYTTDDYFAQLEDNAGLRPESDIYNISIGRIPARTISEASDYISKLKQYINQKPQGEWINKVIVLADDGDNGIHLTHAENEISAFQTSEIGNSKVYEKIYIDAYPLTGGVCKEGRELLLQQIDRGAVLFNYNGHANKYYLTGQGVFTLNDINNLRNKRWPIFFGATCYFMQWDNNDQSGAEKLLFNSSGGIVAAMTATRPVFISENVLMASKFAEEVFKSDDELNILPIGKSFTNAKNKLSSASGVSNSNKLRYGLMGDPALRPVGKTNKISIDSINDEPFNDNTEIILKGRSKYRLKGKITNSENGVSNDFNGRINISFYDSDKSITTKGRDIDGTTGKQMTYDTHGELLYIGSDTVINGLWESQLILPEDIADNFRASTLLMYADSENDNASGLVRSIIVSGIDESQEADTIAPIIEEMYLNESSFKSGDRVNSTPMLFVKVYDDNGINISSIGVGRSMIVKIDERTILNDVSTYYTSSIGENTGGTIVYPLPEMTEGRHKLLFRVSDISGNVAEKEIEFVVDDRLAPEIIDIYTDENPASSQVNFYLVHNRPDALLTITITVYSLSGNLVWSSTVTDRSNLLVSAPITWNLINNGGNRVNRGIYIYRAEVRSNNTRVFSPARRLAVTGR